MATAVVGLQYGDEGKGKIVDALTAGTDYVVRYNGGANAGHTVVNDWGEFALHQVPCGVFYPSCTCLLGTGMAISPRELLAELHMLEKAGVCTDRVLISDRAHLVMPFHQEADKAWEERRGTNSIGTTLRGVGPAYADKADRCGVRAAELANPEALVERALQALAMRNVTNSNWTKAALMEVVTTWAKALEPRLVDAASLMRWAINEQKEILLEGQLGVMKDLDWGTYPYVTSSNTTSAYAPCGAGIPPQALHRVVGVAKAYNTTVGAGPFPTMASVEEGEALQTRGAEFGATTGRIRTTGWFDVPAARYGAYLTGTTELALTKLDVLSGFSEIKLCVAYEVDGERIEDRIPATGWEKVRPVYERLPGWSEDISTCRSRDELPRNAARLIGRISDLLGIPVGLVSVGPHRNALLQW